MVQICQSMVKYAELCVDVGFLDHHDFMSLKLSGVSPRWFAYLDSS